jgi:Flp pilus assembly protein TadD
MDCMNDHQLRLSRGWKIHQQRNYREAESVYRGVLAEAPQDAVAWCYLGIALHDQRRYPEAVEAYETALRLQSEFPIALNNLGNTLRYVGRFEDADQRFEQAIALKPDYLNAFKNRGTLHVWTGRVDSGLRYYEQALQLNPNDAELHRNLGVIYLLQGRFEEGWREYRWRWKVGDLHRPPLKVPVWDGCDLRGKSLLLTAEQGLGDTLHFVRFAKVLRDTGARTFVYAQSQLLALLQQSSALGTAYPNDLPLELSFDYQCSLLDVADILNIDLNRIPNTVPYINPAPGLVGYWAAQLANRFKDKFNIGIAWQGNPDHQADMYRSFPLSCFNELACLPRVQLVSLQQGHGAEQLRDWQGPPIVELQQVDRSSGAFMDTAAIMQHLDLIVTSDTSIAHLAGALGRPTWVILGVVPDWRWMLNRQDTPWYPTMRLFRQREFGDWNTPFHELLGEVQRMLCGENAGECAV